MLWRKAALAGEATLAAFLLACGTNSPTPATTAGSAGMSVSGAAGAVSNGGAAGAADGAAGLAGGGAAGTAASTGGGGAGGSTTAGAGGAAGNGGGGTAGGAGGAASGCSPPATICDDFEKYTSGTTDLSPDWITYTYSGAVKVDGTKPRAGKQSLHLTTQAGMRHYADIIRETRGKALLPLKHFGRMMVWLTAIPPQSHWNLNLSSGPLKGFPEEIGKFAEGGMFGKLMSNYAQRERAKLNGEYLLRGGGPEQGDKAADADCAVAAPSQTISAAKWVCWEWEFDGTADSAFLWIDGQAMTEIDAVHNGKQCQGPGFNNKPMSASYGWESPEVFDKLIIGYEQYQDTPGQEVWIDDVAVGGERIGCPQ